MRIVKKGVMPDGTKIQIEDWSEDYSCYSSCGTVAAYPVAKSSIEHIHSVFGRSERHSYPERNQGFRASFNFDSCVDAQNAFDKLISGDSQLKDFAEYMDHPEYAQCL